MPGKRSAAHPGSANARRAALKVEGLRTLRRTLKEAGIGLEDLRAAHAEVAQTVVRSALPRVPVYSGTRAAVRPGALRESIRGSGTQGAAIVRAGKASVPYAGPIHWGWPSHHIKPNPFLWDAIQASRDQWTGLYLHHLQELIDHIEGAPGP
jgi:hypothetical protein